MYGGLGRAVQGEEIEEGGIAPKGMPVLTGSSPDGASTDID
jgi:hypothetical protein